MQFDIQYQNQEELYYLYNEKYQKKISTRTKTNQTKQCYANMIYIFVYSAAASSAAGSSGANKASQASECWPNLTPVWEAMANKVLTPCPKA